MTQTGSLAAGVDLGGSNLRVGLVREGKVLERHRQPTASSRSPDDVVDAIARALHEVMRNNGVEIRELAGVGVGVPGPVDPVSGISILSPNLGWRDVPIRDLLQARLEGAKVLIDNDVTVVTYGEWRFGAGGEIDDLMCVTVGTGVGAGLILGGKPYRGPGGTAGEIGHIQLDPEGPVCGCGNRGCLELYASAHAVALMAEQRGLASADSGPASAEDVAAAATHGDPIATEILVSAAEALAKGVAVAVNLLNLNRVVIGGGLARAGTVYWEAFERAFRPQVMAPLLAQVDVVPAVLGDDGGVLGGAWMVEQMSGSPS